MTLATALGIGHPVSPAAWLAARGLAGSTAGGDFRARRYWLPAPAAGQARWASEAEFFGQFTGASGRMVVDGSGAWVAVGANAPRFDLRGGAVRLLLEGAATNLLVGSAAPATQSVVVSAATYTISIEGAGSVTLSGAASGALAGGGDGWQGRRSLTFAAAAGTLALTFAGVVANAQLEAGSAATSYIPTIGVAVTRVAETFRLAAGLEAVVAAGSYSAAVRAALLTTTQAGVLISAGAAAEANRVQAFVTSAGRGSLLGASGGVTTANVVTSGGAAIAGGESFGLAVAIAAGNYALDDSRGALVTSAAAGALPAVTRVYLGRRQDGGAPGSGLYDLVAVWPLRLPDARVTALAVAY